MDFTWETQSPNQMGATTQLNRINGRYGDETPSHCKMEFNHRLNTLYGSPSYRMRKTHDETRLFQSDCQNRMPSHALQHPIGCKSSSQFADTVTNRGVSATHNEIPLIYAGDTPGVATLYSRKAQTRMSTCGVGIQTDSNDVRQSYQASPIDGIPFYQTNNPRELYLDNFLGVTSLNQRELQTRMQPYAVGIESSSNKVHQSHQACSTNEIPSHQTGNTIETRPNKIPRVTSLHPREAYSRMPPWVVDIRSDANKVNELYQGSSTNGFPFYQTDNPKELHLDNVPGKTPLDPREVRKRTPPNLVGVQSDSNNAPQFQQASSPKGIQSYRRDNPREMYQMPAGSETFSDQTSRLEEDVPLGEDDFPEGVSTQQDDDATTYEGMKASNPKTNANRSTSPTRCQLAAPEQTSHDLSGARTCPRCHCVLTTQPQLSYLPSLNSLNAHARPSVIMVPLKRKLEDTDREALLPTAQADQERKATRDSPQENEYSDQLSEEDEDDDAEQETFFRVDIDGTTARFKLTKEDWAMIPVKSFPSGGRLLSGHWSRIFADKIKESNPWCSIRFKNNHVRSANSRKVHSSVFFRGGAECKRPECKVKIKLVIREEYGKQVEVAYIGNVCHSDQLECESRDGIHVKSRG